MRYSYGKILFKQVNSVIWFQVVEKLVYKYMIMRESVKSELNRCSRGHRRYMVMISSVLCFRDWNSVFWNDHMLAFCLLQNTPDSQFIRRNYFRRVHSVRGSCPWSPVGPHCFGDWWSHIIGGACVWEKPLTSCPRHKEEEGEAKFPTIPFKGLPRCPKDLLLGSSLLRRGRPLLNSTVLRTKQHWGDIQGANCGSTQPWIVGL